MRWLVLAPLLLAACSYDPPGSCTASSDCRPGLSCSGGVCVGCTSDASCNAWETCRSLDHTCAVRAGMCGSDADCSSWMACGVDHLCALRPGRCSADADCPAWERCDGTHTCALRPGSCNVDADCAAWEQCGAGHLCAPRPGRCAAAADCAAWEICDATHTCVLGPGSCNVDADCAAWEQCGANHACEIGPLSGDVYLYGMLLPWTSWTGALAPVDTPQSALVGFPDLLGVYGDERLANGAMIYMDAGTPYVIRRFVPDPWKWDPISSRWSYPSTPWMNDPVVATPACAAVTHPLRFVVHAGTGAVVYTCYQVSGWWDGAGDPVAPGYEVAAWHANGNMLVTDGAGWFVLSPGGPIVAVSGLPAAPSVFYARSNPNLDGFWLGISNPTAATSELWSVDGAGVAQLGGTFPPFQGTALTGILDAAGVLHGRAMWEQDVTKIVVARCPVLPDTCAIEYNEANKPAGANDFGNPTLMLYPQAARLITTP